MKSARDDAALRLSAVHPEMSHVEKERAATHISRGWTEEEIAEAERMASLRIVLARKETLLADLQLQILQRAKDFKKQCKPPS